MLSALSQIILANIVFLISRSMAALNARVVCVNGKPRVLFFLFLLRHTGYPPCLTLPSRGSLFINALDNSCPRGAAPQVISVRYDKSKLSTSGCLANISATGGTTDKCVTLKNNKYVRRMLFNPFTTNKFLGEPMPSGY